ncbi:hypothetical protein GCM10010988_40170 [Cnuibacter physcomitrellae]|uniref:hypothetical protein n=1 Tax=Cnuibacter physcomitrellae TaxID=1619308 RepID=UPI0012F4CAA5|nr:hypothetical protein [Cnuibacter physcomitrellae]GGI42664.1 hypothetical protein GCM10010988_40170 [Cnuibacter physcomitrellae]
MTESPDDAVRARTRELARRIQLLQDLATAERGAPYNYAEVKSALAEEGVHVSSGRWHYLINGEGALTTDNALLRGLARLFSVEPDFLLNWDDPELPERLLAQRELIQRIRQDKIQKFATRALGELTPESLRAITALIEAQSRGDFDRS